MGGVSTDLQRATSLARGSMASERWALHQREVHGANRLASNFADGMPVVLRAAAGRVDPGRPLTGQPLPSSAVGPQF